MDNVILNDLHIVIGEVLMKLYYDNKSAIRICHNRVQQDRTKHVEVDMYFVKEKLKKGEICISYVPTDKQLTDVLTKN